MGVSGFVYGKFFSGEQMPEGYSMEDVTPGKDSAAGTGQGSPARLRLEANHRLLCLRNREGAAIRFWLGFGGSCGSGGTKRALPENSSYIYDLSVGEGWPDPVFSPDTVNPLLAGLRELQNTEAISRIVLCSAAPVPKKELAACDLHLIATYDSLAPRLVTNPVARPRSLGEKAVDALRTRAPLFTAMASGLLSGSHFRKYLIEGRLAGRPLRIAFNGPKGMARFYSGVIFSQTQSSIRPLLFGMPAGNPIDMDASWFARSSGKKPRGTVLPSFCRSVLSIGDSFDAYLRSLPKSATSDIKKIGANGFTPSISRDFLDLLIFYHSMYLPMLGARHREHSFYLGFPEVAHFFNNGFILFVKRAGCPVAGMISVEHGGVLWGKILGVAAGSAAHTQAGANSAVVYNLIKYAYSRRLATVDLGYSSPFGSDGVLKFKSKWGARLVADRNTDYLCLDFRGEEEKQRFFSAMSPLLLESLELYDPPDVSS